MPSKKLKGSIGGIGAFLSSVSLILATAVYERWTETHLLAVRNWMYVAGGLTSACAIAWLLMRDEKGQSTPTGASTQNTNTQSIQFNPQINIHSTPVAISKVREQGTDPTDEPKPNIVFKQVCRKHVKEVQGVFSFSGRQSDPFGLTMTVENRESGDRRVPAKQARGLIAIVRYTNAYYRGDSVPAAFWLDHSDYMIDIGIGDSKEFLLFCLEQQSVSFYNARNKTPDSPIGMGLMPYRRVHDLLLDIEVSIVSLKTGLTLAMPRVLVRFASDFLSFEVVTSKP